jgi:hypothetical protein
MIHQQQLMKSHIFLKEYLNMQAVCDTECPVTCKHVGSTYDIVAFNCSMLKDLCRQMPIPFHWVGDIVFMNSYGIVAPFGGTNLNLFKDSFNIFHSQIRITIESAFGILIQCWRILRKSLEFNISFVTEIVHAYCR